jgi:mutator protein MutT
VIVTVVAAIIRPSFWEFPGGKVEAGESLQEALGREILEELGVRIQINDECFNVEHAYPNRTVRLHFFNCTILEGEPSALEVVDMRWVEPSELAQFQFPPADAELIKQLERDS